MPGRQISSFSMVLPLSGNRDSNRDILVEIQSRRKLSLTMMPSRWTAKSPMSGYAVAIAATVAVVVLRLLLSRVLGDSAYFFPFVIAVTVSAWYGGLKPGLLSTALGALAAIFFFVPPHYTLNISDPRIENGRRRSCERPIAAKIRFSQCWRTNYETLSHQCATPSNS